MLESSWCCPTSTNATTGAAISFRRGISRVKHLATSFLLVQDYVTRGNQDQGNPHVGERLGHLGRGLAVKHETDHDRTHELQIRVEESWSCIDGVSIVRVVKVVLEYQGVIESLSSVGQSGNL